MALVSTGSAGPACRAAELEYRRDRPPGLDACHGGCGGNGQDDVCMVMALLPATCLAIAGDQRAYSTAPTTIPIKNSTSKTAALNRGGC